ncbi:alkaline phosphatase family protein, partial [Marivirga lumbricoides]
TPNFDTFIKNGAAAESLIPSFPSKTFPNHYTLVTGLYPANHGLVDNSFYDRGRDVVYSMRMKELVTDDYFYGGIPLWQHAQNNGLKTASYFWVGSEAPVGGNFPSYYYNYDGSISNEMRIEQVRKWLELPEEERPRFISLYFSLVDSEGHRYGPVSPQTGEAVKEADRLLGLIRKELSQIDLPVNILITSDHGMVSVKDEKDSFIQLEDYFDAENHVFRMVNNSTHAHLYFKDKSKIDSVFNKLRDISKDFKV